VLKTSFSFVALSENGRFK